MYNKHGLLLFVVPHEEQTHGNDNNTCIHETAIPPRSIHRLLDHIAGESQRVRHIQDAALRLLENCALIIETAQRRSSHLQIVIRHRGRSGEGIVLFEQGSLNVDFLFLICKSARTLYSISSRKQFGSFHKVDLVV